MGDSFTLHLEEISGKRGFIFPWNFPCEGGLSVLRENILQKELDEGETPDLMDVILYSGEETQLNTEDDVCEYVKSTPTTSTPHLKYEVVSNQEEELERVLCVCPGCVVFKKDFQPVPGRLLLRGNRIYLSVACDSSNHVEVSTLIYSSEDIFSKLNRITPRVSSLENLDSSQRIRAGVGLVQASLYGHFIAEVKAMKGKSLLSEVELNIILSRLADMKKEKEIGDVILKIDCGLVGDIDLLNERVLFLRKRSPYFIIVNATVDRLRRLSQCTRTCFNKKKVAPCLKFYLQQKKEMECVKALKESVTFLREICSEMACEIGIEAPYPALDFVLEYIRRASGFIRYCVFNLERPPRSTAEGYLECARGRSHSTFATEFSVSKVLKMIERASGTQLAERDFFPLGVGTAFGPILHNLGLGKFFIQDDLRSTHVTCLLKSKRLKSIPITRLIDIEQLYGELSSAFRGKPQISKFNLYSANKLRKVVERCKYPTVDASLINPMSIWNIQLILVREKRDIFCVSEDHWDGYLHLLD